MFVNGRVRHDLVAVIALISCILVGLVSPDQALAGFSDPAVVTVAAVLIVGRAMELSGSASAIADHLVPRRAPFQLRMSILLVIGALLSAFMNNIAALVITMPIAIQVARDDGRQPAAILMPLSFATILGGMTTLIGTPANLIISSVRERQLGEGFSFFAMTPVGVLVTALGIAYISLIGWRLLPAGGKAAARSREPWLTYEIPVSQATGMARAEITAILRQHRTRLLGIVRNASLTTWIPGGLNRDDRLLVMSRSDPLLVSADLPFVDDLPPSEADHRGAQISVAHGSRLIGHHYQEIEAMTAGALRIVAAGPRAAWQRIPLDQMTISAGDQLFIEGREEDLARFAAQFRLLEVERYERPGLERARATSVVGIFAAAIVSIVAFSVPAWLAFFIAAAAMTAFRLIPAKEVYASIDWSVIVLLAAMIPVGSSFESSGASGLVAQWLGSELSSQSLFVVIAAMCLITMLLSIFLNNVATALVMAPVGIDVANIIHVSPDAILLAVLIGASSDFLTPIGHQNNLLVMTPGGYKFADYSKVGAVLTVVVVVATGIFLSSHYG